MSTRRDRGGATTPAELGESGRRLWRSVLDEYELEEHERALLLNLCRCADVCDELRARVAAEGVISASPHGDRAHPAVTELRQQQIALARLTAALRLPAGDEEADPAGSRRPQRRAGMRGVYGIAGGAS